MRYSLTMQFLLQHSTPDAHKQNSGDKEISSTFSPWLKQHFTDVFNDQELKTLNKAMLKLIEANQIQDPADQ